MMTEAQRKEFLKKMGYSGSALQKELPKPNLSKLTAEKEEKEKKTKKSCLVDKDELLALHRKFNQS